MKNNRFTGAFSIDKDKSNLVASWKAGKSLTPDSSLLKLSIEGDDIEFNTVDKVSVLFEGEVVKYLVEVPDDIKDSVIETVIWLYRKYGNGFASSIDGHFSIIIYDQAIDKFLVIQDKYTCYEKIFWIRKNNIFYFSNNIKTLAKSAMIDPGVINTTAVYQLLLYSYTSPPNTIYKNVFQMEIGEMIVIQEAKLSKSKYDEWSFSKNRIKDEKEAIPLYKEVLTKSVRRLVENNPSSVFLLSGGFDSSVNVALGSEIGSEPLNTVSICTDNRFNTDSPFAKKVSDMFNTKHHEYHFDGHEIEDLPKIIHALGIPYFEPGMMLSYAALGEAARHSKYAIGGEATDQLFGCCSIPAHRRYSMNKKTLGLFSPMYKLAKGVSRSKLLEGNYSARKIEGRLIGKYDVNHWYGAFGYNRSGILKEMLKENFYFPDRWDDLKVPDKDLIQLKDFSCTKLNMEYSFYGILSVYAPLFELHDVTSYSVYTDMDVINFILSLDHDLRERINHSSEKIDKYLHKALAKDIFPPEITNRPKQGGAINSSIHLLDEDFVKRIKNKLLNSEILLQLFKADMIEKMFVPPHFDPIRVFLLVSLDLWYNIFVANPSEEAPTYTFSEYLS